MKKKYASIVMGLALAVLASCSNSIEKIKDNGQPEILKAVSKVSGVARIEPEKGLLYLYSTANGKIQSVTLNENDPVHQGSVLITLNRETDKAQLNQETSKILAQKAAIRSADASAKAMQSNLQKATTDVERNEKLFAARAITGQTLADSKAEVARMLFEYDKQLAELSQSKNKLSEIGANIQYSNAVMNEKIIKAPFNGKVLQWDVHNGDYITIGQKLGQFAPDGPLIAVTEVDELFAEKINTGMKAKIISQLNGETMGEGEVVFVADFLKKKSLFSDETTVEDRRVKEVKVRLKPGTRAMVNSRVDCIIYFK